MALVAYVCCLSQVICPRHQQFLKFRRIGAATSSREPSLAKATASTSFVLAPLTNSADEDARKGSSSCASKVLLGKSEDDLRELAKELGQRMYRGKQLHNLLYKAKVKELDEHSQLPLKFREDLKNGGWKVGRSPIHTVASATDGTIKVLLKLEDNRLVETVGIPADGEQGSHRLTACVSSQVGCPLKCTFCATGKGGYSRNLKPHEIVEQVLVVEELSKRRVTNVVFMGMGEPLLNLMSVLKAHQCLNKDVKIGQRMITISTVGVPNTIKKLAKYKLQSTLAVSLHAPNQKLRENLVPSAKSYPLESLMEDCRDYFLETGRRVSFEYTLLAGVNDSPDHARELAKLLLSWGRGHHVNLIPFNPVAGSDFRRPYRKSVVWHMYGCSIMAGGWTTSKGRTLINFLMATKEIDRNELHDIIRAKVGYRTSRARPFEHVFTLISFQD